MSASDVVVSVRDLSVSFDTEQGEVRAVNGVSMDIRRGRTLAVVGESGCGKSVTALSILGLIADPPGRITGGTIMFGKRDLLKTAQRQMRAIRGNRISMIFQEPMTSLNPVHSVGGQIMEVIELHHRRSGAGLRERAVEMLRMVGIADPQQRADEYPHQMSGGMRQRVMIAMALSCEPELLIADEPTTALDVTIQAQILELLARLQRDKEMAVMLITHDLGVVAENADDVVVMYASKVVEKAGVEAIFDRPLHPYTQGLLRSLPRLGEHRDRLEVIGGSVPDPLHFPTGCKFHVRCPVGNCDRRCMTVEPELREVESGRSVACWRAAGYETKAGRQE
jgi:oligopeptide/dipeptide ABC transporter ATP-binding protein